MPVSIDHLDSFDHIRLTGDLNANEIIDLRKRVDQMMAESTAQQFVVDISEVPLIDSGGLGFLVYLYKKAVADKRRLGIAGAQGQPQDMLHLLKISDVIECKETAEEFA